MEGDNHIITLYIAAWAWQIISFMFLINAIILIALPRTNFTIIVTTAFFILFAGTQYISHKRRKEVQMK